MTPKRRYSFWIDPADADGLKAIKAADGIGESEQIRRAIRDWLQRKKGVTQAARRRAETRRRT